MAISFISKSADALMVSGSVTVNVPAGVSNGNLLITVINSTDVNAPTVSGWTTGIITQMRGGEDLVVYYRIAASEPASYTFAWGIGGGLATMYAYSGVLQSSPLNVAAAAGAAVTSGTTIVAPTLTVSGTDVLLFCVFFTRLASGAFTTPTGMTERNDSSGLSMSTAVDDQLVSTGATGTRTSTFNQTINFGRAVSLAFTPVPVPFSQGLIIL